MSASEPIRIVQITDFHLLADPSENMMGINTEDSFLSVLKLARKYLGKKRADLWLLTGDLAQEAEITTYRRLSRHLQSLGSPSYCLPGNHDEPVLIGSELAQGSVHFCQQLTIGEHWVMVCLNSTIPGDPGGYLEPDQLDLLDAALKEHASRHALVALHHSPLPTGSAWLDTMRLGNADALFALLARHRNVRGLVFGHVHQAMDVQHDGLRLMACPSTCFQFKPANGSFALDPVPPGFRWLELFEDGTIETGVERLHEVPGELDMASDGY